MASKRRLRRAGCESKRSYPTHTLAFDALMSLRRDTGERGMHLYKCPFAPHFHIGHMRRKDKQAREAARKAA